MNQETDAEDKKNDLMSTQESFGVGSSICHTPLTELFWRLPTKPWEPCLSAGAFRGQVARSRRWLSRPENLSRHRNVCHNVDHFVPSEQFM